jgi:hypothetical protein
MANNLRQTQRELVKVIDGKEQFMRSGHQILVERKHKKVMPEWAKDDKEIQKILLRSFPKWRTDKKQAARAGRWARVIQLYFRIGHTHGQIAEEMSLTYKQVHDLVDRIRRAGQGFSANGTRRKLGSRPVGRPKLVRQPKQVLKGI